jgi:hypothetical protein
MLAFLLKVPFAFRIRSRTNGLRLKASEARRVRLHPLLALLLMATNHGVLGTKDLVPTVAGSECVVPPITQTPAEETATLRASKAVLIL